MNRRSFGRRSTPTHRVRGWPLNHQQSSLFRPLDTQVLIIYGWWFRVVCWRPAWGCDWWGSPTIFRGSWTWPGRNWGREEVGGCRWGCRSSRRGSCGSRRGDLRLFWRIMLREWRWIFYGIIRIGEVRLRSYRSWVPIFSRSTNRCAEYRVWASTTRPDSRQRSLLRRPPAP